MHTLNRILILASLVFTGCETPIVQQDRLVTDVTQLGNTIWKLDYAMTLTTSGDRSHTGYAPTYLAFFEDSYTAKNGGMLSHERFSFSNGIFQDTDNSADFYSGCYLGPGGYQYNVSRTFTAQINDSQTQLILTDENSSSKRIAYFSRKFSSSSIPPELVGTTWELTSTSSSYYNSYLSIFKDELLLNSDRTFEFTAKYRSGSDEIVRETGFFGVSDSGEICFMPREVMNDLTGFNNSEYNYIDKILRSSLNTSFESSWSDSSLSLSNGCLILQFTPE